MSHGEYEDDDQEIEQEMRRFASGDEQRPGRLRRSWPIILIFGVLAVLVLAAFNSREPKRRRGMRCFLFLCFVDPWP